MNGHVFIAPGDITRLSADAIAYSASSVLTLDGNLASSFTAAFPPFVPWLDSVRKVEEIPFPVGSTFWLPLSDQHRPRGIVLVVATGRADDIDKPGTAVRNAILRATEELRQVQPAGRLLIALPAFRVGRGGDHARRLTSAIAQVQSAITTLRDLDNVDVVFMTYTPALYQIFLQARRQVLGPPVDMSYPELEQALRAKACVLFVGAGLSSSAGLPGWNELIARLSHDLQIKSNPGIDHLDLAQWYKEQFGSDRLAEILGSTFSGHGTLTLAHYLLMGLPVRHVITTNYDCLLEDTLDALKRHPVPVIRQEEVGHTGGTGVYVVKLHGDANHPHDIVLTRDDYTTFFERRPAMAALLEGLLLNQTFFFVGYSLRDPNFRQVFSKIARNLQKSQQRAFAASFEAKGDTAKYLQTQWDRQGLELIPIQGETQDEQTQVFLRFLDMLGDRVAYQASPLSLAEDAPVADALLGLRDLLKQLGNETIALSKLPASNDDLPMIADVIDFLADHGWRPQSPWGRLTVAGLYENLADLATDPTTRRRLLISALACAEAFEDVCRLRRELDPSD